MAKEFITLHKIFHKRELKHFSESKPDRQLLHESRLMHFAVMA